MDAAGSPRPSNRPLAERELRAASRTIGGPLLETTLSVPRMTCARCMAAVETTLANLPGVASARVNLTTRQVAVRWRGDASTPDFCALLGQRGYEATLIDATAKPDTSEMTRLFRATAVAGFAAMNIMLMSVSIWLGADAATRQAFHIWSAILAAPALAYSGRIFFASAWRALRAGRTNMDVPISVGILLTFTLSVFDTFTRGPHAYFDAVTSLMFALLAGRTLDLAMRQKAHDAVAGLARLMPRGATVIRSGERQYCTLKDIVPGDLLELGPGDRFPVDGTIVEGAAHIDMSAITGETAPETGEVGRAIYSGAMNLDGVLLVRADKRADDSFLADISRMMGAAQEGRARYRRIADRAATLYAPAVHLLALATLAGWLAFTSDWHISITAAVAVLVVTCPCALGLAVPMAHVMAARRLFDFGITFKDGGALERLADVTTIVFDKTGTLTTGRMHVESLSAAPADLAAAAAMAQFSRHPAARAVAATTQAAVQVEDFREHPGQGIEATVGGARYRLGRAPWVAEGDIAVPPRSSVWLSREGEIVGHFVVADQNRPGAPAAIRDLAKLGIRMEIVSGDVAGEVRRLAQSVGIDDIRWGALPADKVARLRELAKDGQRVLMVGDGLNDTPALAAAPVSMAPSSATDIGRGAADFVFMGQSLEAVPRAITVARAAKRIVQQNFGLAIVYNAFAVPLAVAGLVTPLIAAIAMAASSILVVANSLRLSQRGREERLLEQPIGPQHARIR